MRVLLSTAPSDVPEQTIPDLGLGYLATALRRSGHEVRIVQPEREGGGFEPVARMVREFEPGLLGFKAFSLDFAAVRDALAKAREQNPALVTVIGGPHPSCADPAELFEDFPHLDFAFAGEADRGLPRLLDQLEREDPRLEEVPGLILRNQGGIRQNPRLHVDDLDELGLPSWDLLEPRGFDNRWSFWLRGRPAAPISTSRGCPFQCTFCAQQIVSGKGVRRRSPAHVMDELLLLHEQYGLRHFDFIDDNFVTRRQYVQELCERILEAGLHIEWSCAGVHLKGLTPDLIRLMERSGCRSLVVGVESGNDEILRHMRKGIGTQEVRKRLEIVREVSKMMVMGQFILGYPLDTPRTIRQTIDFARRLPLDLATFYSFIPLPGSEAYTYLLERGEIQAPDWKAVRIAGTCYAPPGMTVRQLTHLRRVAYLRFYLRPRILGRMAREIATPRQIGAYLSRIKGRLLQA